MISILIKKELRSIWMTTFVKRKKSKWGKTQFAPGYALLYGAVFVILLAFFFVTAFDLAISLVPMGLGWFYFSLMALMATALGVVGDAFNTHTMMYEGKDNDILFSLPIKARDILISRMVVVLIMGTIYMGVVFIPAIAAYFLALSSFSFSVLLLDFVVMAGLILIVTTFSCILGWGIALVSSRMKSRYWTKLILTILFFLLYMFFTQGASKYIENIVLNAGEISASFSSFYLVAAVGYGAVGSVKDALIFILFSIVLFVLAFIVIERNYLSLSITSERRGKKEYSEKKIHSSSLLSALIKKEGRKFISSTVYALNTGMGIILMVGGAVALFIWRKNVLDVIALLKENGWGIYVPLLEAVAISLLLSMNGISAPSISLEGKNLWVLKSLPIDSFTILEAKILFSFILNFISSLILIITATMVGVIDPEYFFLMIVFSLLSCLFQSEAGVIFNLLHPSLNWTNEARCVKNGLATYLSLLSGWGLSAVFGFLYFKVLYSVMSFTLYMMLFIILLLALVIGGWLWLKKKVVKIFENLG